MQHAVALSGEEEDQMNAAQSDTDSENNPASPSSKEPVKLALSYVWSGIKGIFNLLRPSTIRNGYQQFREMTATDMVVNIFRLIVFVLRLLMMIVVFTFR